MSKRDQIWQEKRRQREMKNKEFARSEPEAPIDIHQADFQPQRKRNTRQDLFGRPDPPKPESEYSQHRPEPAYEPPSNHTLSRQVDSFTPISAPSMNNNNERGFPVPPQPQQPYYNQNNNNNNNNNFDNNFQTSMSNRNQGNSFADAPGPQRLPLQNDDEDRKAQKQQYGDILRQQMKEKEEMKRGMGSMPHAPSDSRGQPNQEGYGIPNQNQYGNNQNNGYDPVRNSQDDAQRRERQKKAQYRDFLQNQMKQKQGGPGGNNFQSQPQFQMRNNNDFDQSPYNQQQQQQQFNNNQNNNFNGNYNNNNQYNNNAAPPPSKGFQQPEDGFQKQMAKAEYGEFLKMQMENKKGPTNSNVDQQAMLQMQMENQNSLPFGMGGSGAPLRGNDGQINANRRPNQMQSLQLPPSQPYNQNQNNNFYGQNMGQQQAPPMMMGMGMGGGGGGGGGMNPFNPPPMLPQYQPMNNMYSNMDQNYNYNDPYSQPMAPQFDPTFSNKNLPFQQAPVAPAVQSFNRGMRREDSIIQQNLQLHNNNMMSNNNMDMANVDNMKSKGRNFLQNENVNPDDVMKKEKQKQEMQQALLEQIEQKKKQKQIEEQRRKQQELEQENKIRKQREKIEKELKMEEEKKQQEQANLQKENDVIVQDRAPQKRRNQIIDMEPAPNNQNNFNNQNNDGPDLDLPINNMRFKNDVSKDYLAEEKAKQGIIDPNDGLSDFMRKKNSQSNEVRRMQLFEDNSANNNNNNFNNQNNFNPNYNPYNNNMNQMPPQYNQQGYPPYTPPIMNAYNPVNQIVPQIQEIKKVIQQQQINLQQQIQSIQTQAHTAIQQRNRAEQELTQLQKELRTQNLQEQLYQQQLREALVRNNPQNPLLPAMNQMPGGMYNADYLLNDPDQNNDNNNNNALYDIKNRPGKMPQMKQQANIQMYDRGGVTLNNQEFRELVGMKSLAGDSQMIPIDILDQIGQGNGAPITMSKLHNYALRPNSSILKGQNSKTNLHDAENEYFVNEYQKMLEKERPGSERKPQREIKLEKPARHRVETNINLNQFQDSDYDPFTSGGARGGSNQNQYGGGGGDYQNNDFRVKTEITRQNNNNQWNDAPEREERPQWDIPSLNSDITKEIDNILYSGSNNNNNQRNNDNAYSFNNRPPSGNLLRQRPPSGNINNNRPPSGSNQRPFSGQRLDGGGNAFSMAARGVLGGQTTFGYGQEGMNAEGFTLNSDFPDLSIGDNGLQIGLNLDRGGMGSRQNSNRYLQKENTDSDTYKPSYSNNNQNTFSSNTPKETIGAGGTMDIDFINQKNENRLKRLENLGLKTVNEDDEMRNRNYNNNQTNHSNFDNNQSNVPDPDLDKLDDLLKKFMNKSPYE